MNFLSGNLAAVDPLVSALGTLNKSISLFAAFSLIGVLLALSFLLVEREGKLQESALKLLTVGSGFCSSMVCNGAPFTYFYLADISGTNLGAAFDATTLTSFVRQVELGQYLAFQTVVVGIVLISVNFIRCNLPSVVCSAITSH
jgi:putative copper resistance protein D